MRLDRVWLIYRAESPIALREARRCASELSARGTEVVLAMSGQAADPYPGLLASEPELPDLAVVLGGDCLLYTSPSPRDKRQSRMPSSA